MTEAGVAALAEGCVRLSHVDLFGCSDKITAKHLEPVIERCPRLLPDELIFEKKDDSFAAAVAKQHPKLTSIHLANVTDTGIAALASSCNHLTSVDLIHTTPSKVSGGALAELVGACPKLLPDAVKVKKKTHEFITAVGKMHPELTSINLQDADVGGSDVLRTFAINCPNLIYINLHKSNAAKLAPFIENCPHLLPDNIISIKKDDEFCSAVAKQHPNLTSLDLKNCKSVTPTGLESLAVGCVNLVNLDLTECPVTDRALAEIIERANSLLPDCVKSLKKGDMFCAAVAKKFPGLESINLSSCAPVSGIGVSALAACKDLSSINLKGCRVTDASLAKLVRACPKLTDANIVSKQKGDRYCAAMASRSKDVTVIDLQDCLATDAGLEVLVTNCPNLMPDDIASTNKGDRFCVAVAKQHPGLTSINLANCVLSGRGAVALVEGCKDLTSIDMTDCSNILDRDLAALVRDFPRLDPNNIKCSSKGMQFCVAVCKIHPELTSLDLRIGNYVTDMTCATFAKTCTNLTDVDLRKNTTVTDEGTAKFITSCPKLLPDKIRSNAKGDLFCAAVAKRGAEVTSVDFTDCLDVTRNGLTSLAGNCSGLLSLILPAKSKMSVVLIDRCLAAILRGCPKLLPDKIVSIGKGDSFCAALGERYPDITSISLKSCCVTDGGLASLRKSCNKITALDLSDCALVTDDGLAQLLYAFPNMSPHALVSTSKGDQYCVALGELYPGMTAIDLAGCAAVSDKGLASLAKNFPDLQAVDLSGNTKVTDKAVAKLAIACPKLLPRGLKTSQKGDKYCEALSMSHSNLSSIDLSGCSLLTDKGTSSLSNSCPNLVAVDLQNCHNVTDSGLARLVTALPKLQLEKLKSNAKGDEYCTAVAAQHTDLTTLDLSSSAALTTKGLAVLMQSCTRLQKVNTSNCGQIDDPALASLIKQFPRLHANTIVSEKKGDLFCAAVAKEQPNLTSIDLHGCADVTLKGLLAIGANCSRLTSVDIGLCKAIKTEFNTSLANLGQTCRYLSTIKFGGCEDAVTDDVITRIAESCRRLRFIDVSACAQLSPDAIVKLAASCKQLEVLHLAECNEAATDAVVVALDQNCPGLVQLSFATCKRLTEACLASMPRNLKQLDLTGCLNIENATALGNRCSQLVDLNLAGCSKVANASIIELAKGCVNLETLVLAGCYNVTDDGATALTNCSKLAVLNLAGCFGVTDSSLVAIAKANKQLRDLNLALCSKLTDATITALTKHSRHLTTLNLVLCNQLTDDAVSALAASNTNLDKSELIEFKNLTKETFLSFVNASKVVGFPRENIKYPDKIKATNDEGTIFAGNTSYWCSFVHPIPFPRTGVHTATIRFDDITYAMIGVTNNNNVKKITYAGSTKEGWSMYSNRGEVYHNGRSSRGETKNFKTRENNGHPTYASVIYNADTKKLSWKSNDTKWENSHEVQTSAERDHKLWFTVSCQYTTKFEVVCTSWVQPESSLSAEFLDMIKRYVDLDIVLSHTE